MLSFYEKNLFVGFCYLINNNNLTFIPYLAINDNIRSKGYGTKIINKIKSIYKDNRIILDIEPIDKNSENNEQRIRRKNFYNKNGFRSLPILMLDGEETYEILIYNGECTTKEFNNLYKNFIGKLSYMFAMPKLVQVN